ncbi:ATP-dependent zinc protease family protein [Vibrio quintilis]|uniref:Protein SlyX n=1 Tax=Vibrio quintilis TaxID=1117707 RepID=A0A1M7YTZ1_9VIBR|nr:RimK/LysX family protein [Vibrio quintilis]SHO56124.1 Protein SlyX [Vibrio quintilis]
MLKRLALMMAISALTGCSSVKEDNFHKETLSAIKNAELSISQRLTNLELQSSHQAKYIDGLETEINSLKHQMTRLNQHMYQIRKKDKSEQKAASDIQQETEYPPVQDVPANKIILGRVEHVTIDSIQQTFNARVDTGAATSSLNAANIEEFERNGKKWVRFHLSEKTADSLKNHWIEAPVIRYVKIRQSTNNEAERRAVVSLWVSVGKIHERTEFTLANRSHMSHPVLLGREFIRDIALVDVSRKFIHTPNSKSSKNKS